MNGSLIIGCLAMNNRQKIIGKNYIDLKSETVPAGQGLTVVEFALYLNGRRMMASQVKKQMIEAYENTDFSIYPFWINEGLSNV